MGNPITEDDFEHFGYKITAVDRIYAIIYSVAFLSMTSIVLYYN